MCGAVLGAVLMTSGAAQAATTVSSRFAQAALFGSYEDVIGNSRPVYKLSDGATNCYIVSGQFPAISCVK